MIKLVSIMLLNSFISFAVADTHIMKNADDLEWKDGPKSLPAGSKVAVIEGDPGQKGPFTIRLKFPANYRIMPHYHPGIEHVTVMDGEFYMGAGNKYDEAKAMELDEEGMAVMPAKFNHFAFTKDEDTVVQLHGIGPWEIIYLNPKDDPRL